jgi:hypothetical protein
VEAQLWQLSENLHRAELTKLQYDQQVVKYAELLKAKRAGETVTPLPPQQQCQPEADKVRQLAAVSGGDGLSRQLDEKVSQQANVKPAGRPEGGNSAVARALNVPEATVRRAYQTASLSPEAQAAAVETGLDDNRSALLEAAKEHTPEAQTAIIRRLAERKASTAEPATPGASARPLRDFVGISGGELARWIKITTPNDRPHVIRVLEMAAAILCDELEGHKKDCSWGSMDKGRRARTQDAFESSNAATGDREEDETNRAGASAKGGNSRHWPGTSPLTPPLLQEIHP